MNYLIGVDIGTSGTKTILFDENLNIIASAHREYPMFQPQNGWAEQQPEDWKKASLDTLKEVIKTSNINSEEIKGIGLSGQMHGLVMLDELGNVIRPSIIWCDQRTGNEVFEITEKIGRERLIEITANPALTGWTAAKILWVKNNEPENYSICKHILLPKDYIRYVLTGKFATEYSDASGTQLLDVPNRCWSDELLEKLDIDKSLLPKLYESYEVTGNILPRIAEITGLSTNTAVVGGASDNSAAAIGSGIVEDGNVFTTVGTSGVVYAHSSKIRIDPKGRVHTCCSAVPGAWHVMGVTQSAGLSLKWFKDNFCQDYIVLADKKGVKPYDLMNEDVETVPIGSNKLIYLPYLMGERTPHLNPDCRGVFFGLSAIHTKKDLIRAIIEGVSYSLKDCNDILNEMGIYINEMKVCGGGASSGPWRQILSDVYGLDVKTIMQVEGPALGAAILAGVGVSIFVSVESACKKFITVDKINKPIVENTEKYNKLHNIYKNLYYNLQDQYKNLASL